MSLLAQGLGSRRLPAFGFGDRQRRPSPGPAGQARSRFLPVLQTAVVFGPVLVTAARIENRENPAMKVIYGTRARLSCTFRTPTGVLTDPKRLRLVVTTAAALGTNKTTTTYVYGTDTVVVRDFVGTYHFDILCNFLGQISWRWESFGYNEEVVEAGLYFVTSS